MIRLIALAALALAFAAPVAAAPGIPVTATPRSFTIPAGNSTDSFYVDVGADASRLEVDLDAASPASDIDLFVRYGTPFPDAGTALVDFDYFVDLAHYRSISLEGSERIVIGKSNVYPVREGRWYIVVVNGTTSSVNATLAARTSAATPASLPIDVVFDDATDNCNVAPWNDATPRAPIGGNDGATLGAQRRQALLEAARLLGTQLKSPVPIRVQACWEDLGGGNTVTLAQAGPANFLRNEKFFPRNQTFFALAPATKLAGTRTCGLVGGACASSYDIRASFNIQVDGPGALGASSFYYGFTPDAGSVDSDFITVAMHEITHGLGFLSLINSDPANGPLGTKEQGYDDAYIANLVSVDADNVRYSRFSEGSDADRSAAIKSVSRLRWDGSEAVGSLLNPQVSSAAPDSFIKLFAPATIQPGSSVDHIGFGYPNEIMRPQITGPLRTIGLAAPMLNAMGWSDAPATPKSAVVPPNGLYFDPSHPGHGIGFTRVAGDTYFLAFYTYDAAGAPEWYIAIGPVVDGVFTPAANENGDSLVKYKYVAGAMTPQQADASVQGKVRVDFNQAALAPACNDGVAHDRSGPLGVMTFTIAARTTQNPASLSWCMQPLIPASLATTPDFTGTWYGGPTDSGWGFSLASYTGDPKSLFGVLYYPDANGNGRWAYLISDRFANGAQMSLVERHGYCRTCAVPAAVQAGQFDDRPAGTITLNLGAAVQNQSAGPGTFSLNYQLGPGGTFARANFPMTLLSVPAGM